MPKITSELLTSLGITWEDDNPKQKLHYEGDIIVTIAGLEFSNSMTLDEGFYSHNPVICFRNLEELQIVWQVLNNWEKLQIPEEINVTATAE